jgi:hypothetical protein
MSLTHRHGDDLRLTHECLPPRALGGLAYASDFEPIRPRPVGVLDAKSGRTSPRSAYR